MARKITYAELEKQVRDLEEELAKCKYAEDALRRSKYYLDRITKGMYESLLVIDRNFVIEDVNDRFLSEYGGSRADLIGKTCYEVTHRVDEPCSGSEHRCPAKEVFETSKPTRVEHTHVDKKGEDVIVEIYAFPLFAQDGDVEHVVEVHHNITELRQAEQERIHREKLEGVLEMAGAVCHELNQPMQAASLYSERLLQKMSEHDPVYDQVNKIKDKIDMMAEITLKLQRIARYSTKDYVGGTKIIDIDEASRGS